MLIDALAHIIDASGCVGAFWDKLDNREDATLGVASSARPFLIAARFAHAPQPTLVVVAGRKAALDYARTIASYIGEENVMVFPEKDALFSTGRPEDKDIIAKRHAACFALRQRTPIVIVASARSLSPKLAPPSAHADAPLILSAGCELADMDINGVDDLTTLCTALERLGYENTGELDGVGTFALRGGVLDIYPGNLAHPLRLDFFGDELEEIRCIVAATGQTISGLDEIEIFPIVEFPLTEQTMARARKALEKPALTNKATRELYDHACAGVMFEGYEALMPSVYGTCATLGDYACESALIALVEPRSIFDDISHYGDEIAPRAKEMHVDFEGLFATASELRFEHGERATYASVMQRGSVLDDELIVKKVDIAGAPEKLYSRMRQWVQGSYTCVFSVPNYRARKDFELAFVDAGIPIEEHLDVAEARGALSKHALNIVDADIPLGLVIPKAKLVFASVEDLKGSRSGLAQQSTLDITDITFPYAPGDYVVHEKYGIALFKDLVLREIDGVMRDYLELDYAAGDKLFLPAEQFDKVTKYVGPEGAHPKITRLDSSDWSNALAKARKATKKLAFDLVDVYARRAATKGHRFNVDTPWMREMEESFPFDETPDQAAAIADVKADMRSSRPMDRLICGDVGFGKTEVALRAAFACAQDKKQVMVLCPTTILAQQHFTNFKERMEPFGMKVEVLSRFRTHAEQASALEGFAEGSVDILIGTHRLLSRDVNPHDLGLVIIDEEQRFGVGHKEQLKHMREYIDVLTLSATPIPRTMQMAVSGVRDMSLIMTPPDERLPVKVHVGEWDLDVVSEAIRYELARGGQVYYVSNRVRTIDDALESVLEAAPEARVGVAHGQMSKDELERVMEDFSAGELDVLVATTIIESGIDNPHTNTLIIEDAQRLGLAQMYQLKGRVGRSSTQAYAYFMFPEESNMTEEAHARLEALSDHQDLGSGMKIALKDLEIRGAGNILGAEQSGNMSVVGFDLFAQMLNQAVFEARQGTEGAEDHQQRFSDITINVPGHMYLPADYILDIDTRVLWYRKIACAATIEQIDQLQEQLQTLLPDMPQAVKNLFDKARLKAFAAAHGITNISLIGDKVVVENIALAREELIVLKRKGARYLKDKKKLLVPKTQFVAKGADSDQFVSALLGFFDDLYNRSTTQSSYE